MSRLSRWWLPACLGLAVVVAIVLYPARTLDDDEGPRAADPGPQARPPKAAPSPRTAGEWFEYGNTRWREAKDLRGAEEAYRRAIEIDSRMADAHYALGLVLLELHSPKEAGAALESALVLAPPDAGWRADAEKALARAHLLDR